MRDVEEKRIYILIPAYNEENKIESVIRDLHTNGYNNILVVDDGSSDRTRSVSIENKAEVLSHIINRGQGAALRTGIEYLREVHDPDIIVTFDADGQHSASDIPHLITPILLGIADVVLGSRFLKKEKYSIPIMRKIVLQMGVFFTNITSGIKLTDTHNGFRAFNRIASKTIQITQRKMEHASEIIDEIKRKKLRYREIPVNIKYSEYSKAKGQKTSSFIKLGLKIIIKKISS